MKLEEINKRIKDIEKALSLKSVKGYASIVLWVELGELYSQRNKKFI